MTTINSSGTSIVRELGTEIGGSPLQSLEQVPENLTFSVVTVPSPVDPNAIGWKPKTVNTAYPAGHVNLPYALAVELCQFLNGIEGRACKGRLSFVCRRLKGSCEKFDVLSVPGRFDHLQGKFVFKDYCITGVSLDDAITEAVRINTEILRYANVPKIWAVVIADGVGNRD